MDNLIFDIGANKGLFTDKYINDYSIICVEANPNLGLELKEKYKNKNNVICENIAISNTIGNIFFDVCLDDQMSSCNPNWLRTLRYKNAGIIKTINVPCFTLDYLIEKYGTPKHIKIDVEGHEYEVLCGLSKRVCPIQFEFIGEYFMDITVPVLNKLLNIGYNKFSIKISCGDFDIDDKTIKNCLFYKHDEFIDMNKNLGFVSGMILAI